MAESMVGIKRSHRCTEVTTANIGQDVTVMGWVQKSRNKGGIIFVDLRDRSGILQIIFEESDCGDGPGGGPLRRGEPESGNRRHRGAR